MDEHCPYAVPIAVEKKAMNRHQLRTAFKIIFATKSSQFSSLSYHRMHRQNALHR